jgi:hypothetical protein
MLTKTELKHGVRYAGFCPEGHTIKGSLDTIPGCALIDCFELSPAGGELFEDYAGETEVFWDEQTPQTDENRETIYLCDEGCQVSTSELTFQEVCDD